MPNHIITATLIICSALLSIPATAAKAPERFNVRDFGAVGNGIVDDQPAINKAVQAVTKNKGGVLWFPYGTYRCARQAGPQDGVAFVGVSGVTVLFDPGAVLLMDNLNPDDNRGDRGHGILFRGPSRNISVINATVKWKTKPSKRSYGDGIRFEGYPSDDKTISNIKLLQCSTEFSPQTGAIFMGCSDIYVENFRCTLTGGDGLHINACRRVHVTGVTGIANGDDTLAFVTYQDDKEELVDGGTHGPYARPDLGEWNCSGSTATGVYAQGGRANGIRLAGAKNIAISNVVVEDKLCGITADSGKKDATTYGWTYLPSRGITITNLTAIRCNSGFFIWNFNQPMTGDENWWRSDITLSNMIAKDCTNDSFNLTDVGGVNIHGVRAENCRIRIRHARDCAVDGVTLTNAPFIVVGQEDAANVAQSPKLNVTVRNLDVDNGAVNIYNCRGISCSDIRVTQPTGQGVNIDNLFESRIDGVGVE